MTMRQRQVNSCHTHDACTELNGCTPQTAHRPSETHDTEGAGQTPNTIQSSCITPVAATQPHQGAQLGVVLLLVFDQQRASEAQEGEDQAVNWYLSATGLLIYVRGTPRC